MFRAVLICIVFASAYTQDITFAVPTLDDTTDTPKDEPYAVYTNATSTTTMHQMNHSMPFTQANRTTEQSTTPEMNRNMTTTTIATNIMRITTMPTIQSNQTTEMPNITTARPTTLPSSAVTTSSFGILAYICISIFASLR